MRSGTSFFDWTVFKKTVFRFWPLWGVYFTGWLVSLPLSGLMSLRMESAALQIYAAGFTDVYRGYMGNFAFNQVPQSVTGSGMVTFVFFGVLAAMAVFSHLYNHRSANLFGSLPIRREGLFLTHYLAGLAFLIVPNIVIFLLTLAVEAAGGVVCWTGLLFWLAVACGEGFFFYTLAVFCAMFTGHILALPAFYAIVNGFVMGVTGLVYTVFRLSYYGFADFPDGVYTVVEWFTPAAWLADAVACEAVWVHESAVDSILYNNKMILKIEGLGTVGIYAIVAVVLAVCAFLLYRVRRLESAGDVVAVKPMRPVFKYGVAFCAGLAFGMGTTMIIGGGDITRMVAIVVWGVIGYFAAEMLLQKSFKVFRKWKGAAAVTAVFLALFLVVGFDLTGFETRIPAPDSVERVEVSGLEAMHLGDSGDWFKVDITDQSMIRMITLIHKAAVEQRDEVSHAGVSTNLRVTYHLKNGGALSREYYNIWVLPIEVNLEGSAGWALQQIYDNKELCWQMYGFDELESYLAQGGRLAWAEHEFYDDHDGMRTDAVYYGIDAEALLAAVKEDFFAGRIGARRVTADKLEAYNRDEYESLTFISDDRDDGGSYYIQITLSATASSTRAVLEEMTPAAEQNGTGMPRDTQA